jgi:hypothetical protein
MRRIPDGFVICLIPLLACLWKSTAQATLPANILATGARNVREYGAKGDGSTDDTQAFLNALNQDRSHFGRWKTTVNVYVPPGRYLITSTLILWSHTQMFGEWTNPPTLVLASNSSGFQDPSNPNPFIVTSGGYNLPDYSPNWKNRTDQINGSTNNTFFIVLEDLNIEIGQPNPGAWALFWYCAQQTALRHVTVNAGTSLGCLQTGWWGGGSVISNCTFVGGQIGYSTDATSTELIRACKFTAQSQYSVFIKGGWMYTFLDTQFDNTAPLLLDAGFEGVINILDSSLNNMPRATLLDPYHHGTVHIEKLAFDHISQIPDFLQLSTDRDRVVLQWTNANVVKGGRSFSGQDASLNQDIYPGTFQTRDVPRPTAACVNIRDVGAVGNGIGDDTQVINDALSQYSEIFFPLGTYLVNQGLTIKDGQKLFGNLGTVIKLAAKAQGFEAGSTKPFITVNGAGSKGVIMCHLFIHNDAPGGICVSWNGNPSSRVCDCQFLNVGPSSSAPLMILNGGGYFENMLIPAGTDFGKTGIFISSKSPVWLYSVQPQHYTEQAIVLLGARNVVMLNIDLETSSVPGKPGTVVKIKNSQNVFVLGLGAGNWQAAPGLIKLYSGQNIHFWNMIAINLPYMILDDSSGSSITYGSGSPDIRHLSKLAGFVKD